MLICFRVVMSIREVYAPRISLQARNVFIFLLFEPLTIRTACAKICEILVMKAKAKADNLPDLIRKWRTARSLTKADAARKLKIPYRTLQDWELGNRTPRGFALQAIKQRLKRR